MSKQQNKVNPPSHLSAAMKEFWSQLNKDYDFNPEHLQILRIACEQFDRAQVCREAIKKDGMILAGKRHPLLGVEAKAGELFLRGVRDLGMETEVPTK